MTTINIHGAKPRLSRLIAEVEAGGEFYNPRRKHSALGWKPPVAFEQWAA